MSVQFQQPNITDVQNPLYQHRKITRQLKSEVIDQLILFTRFPEPGKVKTRLIPALSKQGASDLHRQLTTHCIEQISPILTEPTLNFTLFYTGGSAEQMHKWLPDISLKKQQGINLGKRMTAAFTYARDQAQGKIILFGSDCPELDNKILLKSLQSLQTHDVVLGPTYDGGYYLIGISTTYNATDFTKLFIDIPWGTADVFNKTLSRLEASRYSCRVLPTLHDIDQPEDLEYFHHHPCS